MSPVVELRDVTVTNEQTRITWRAESGGEVRQGLIAVRGTPPEGLVDRASHTYTIVARDRGDRVRAFRGLVVAAASAGEVTFR